MKRSRKVTVQSEEGDEQQVERPSRTERTSIVASERRYQIAAPFFFFPPPPPPPPHKKIYLDGARQLHRADAPRGSCRRRSRPK